MYFLLQVRSLLREAEQYHINVVWTTAASSVLPFSCGYLNTIQRGAVWCCEATTFTLVRLSFLQGVVLPSSTETTEIALHLSYHITDLNVK